eukprot:3717662-Rhodomonas_salina.1
MAQGRVGREGRGPLTASQTASMPRVAYTVDTTCAHSRSQPAHSPHTVETVDTVDTARVCAHRSRTPLPHPEGVMLLCAR